MYGFCKKMARPLRTKSVSNSSMLYPLARMILSIGFAVKSLCARSMPEIPSGMTMSVSSRSMSLD